MRSICSARALMMLAAVSLSLLALTWGGVRFLAELANSSRLLLGSALPVDVVLVAAGSAHASRSCR